MDWEDSPEQAAFRLKVRTFIKERLPEYYRSEEHRIKSLNQEHDWQMDMASGEPHAEEAARVWADALAEHGWGAAHWPKEYGGGGLSTLEQYILKEEFAALDAPKVGGTGLSLLGPTVLIHGNEDQKKKYLAPTLSGEMLWAQGFSEPGAGSDLASLQARAVRDGDDYIINGQKMWTSSAHKSNWIFGLFRTDPEAPKHRGITFMVMDMKTPGISVRPIYSLGWAHRTNETFYEDVRVPAENVIGEVNRGWYVGVTLLDYERSGIDGAVKVQKDLDQLFEYLHTPEGERRSAWKYQLSRHDLADRAIEAVVLKNIALRVVSMQGKGLVPNYEASMSKIARSELMQKLANSGMKVFGLYAHLWDRENKYVPLEAQFTQNYLDNVVQTIFAGSNEIQRNIIATRGLGLPRG